MVLGDECHAKECHACVLVYGAPKKRRRKEERKKWKKITPKNLQFSLTKILEILF